MGRRIRRNLLLAGASLALATITPGPVGLGSGSVEAACSTSAWVGRYVYTPTFASGQYRSNGWLTQSPDVYCFGIEWKIFAQTKVCGFWGCNWHTKGDKKANPLYSTSIYLTAYQPCRDGTHTYRTLGTYVYHPPFANYPQVTTHKSSEPKLTCY